MLRANDRGWSELKNLCAFEIVPECSFSSEDNIDQPLLCLEVPSHKLQ